jgi:hypothetical protein
MTGREGQEGLVGDLFRWAQATYGWHRVAFIAVNVVITAVNVWSGPPWWGVWPLLITGALFTLHFLIYKTSMVSDEWVDERATDVYARSYDQGHIDSIAGHHDIETPLERTERELKERHARRKGRRRGEEEG